MTGEEEKEKENQQEGEKENEKDILQKEIESWNNHFGYALREENRILLLFNKILSECQAQEEYAKALDVKGEYFIYTLLNLIVKDTQNQKERHVMLK
jgi:hypothetical protein